MRVEILEHEPILACPCCGHWPILEQRTTKYVKGYGVYCEECLTNNWEEEQPYESAEEAIYAWNSRSDTEAELLRQLETANKTIIRLMGKMADD